MKDAEKSVLTETGHISIFLSSVFVSGFACPGRQTIRQSVYIDRRDIADTRSSETALLYSHVTNTVSELKTVTGGRLTGQ